MQESKQARGVILWVIAAVQFLTPFMFSAIGVALPAIGREFSAGAVQLGLIEMVYILAVALLLLPIGRFADIHGRRRIFLSGTLLLTLATFALATAPTVNILIIFRFVQGIGAAMITSTSLAILTSIYPPEERGRAMGVVVGCVYLGISAGPTLAGLMIDFLGWRWIFYSAVPVEVLILLFALTRLKGEWADSRGERFDWIGSILYIIALSGIIIGVLEAQRLPVAGWLAGGGILVMIAFLFYENSIAYPIFPLKKIIANRVFALSNIATWLNYAASFGIMFFFSIYLQVIRGVSPKVTGFILITQPLLQAFFAPLAGKMADKHNPAPIATLGMAFCTAGLVAAAGIHATSSFISIFAVLIVMGVGFGLFSTPNTTAIMASIDRRDYGMASSMIATMRTTGMLTAMTLITILLSAFLGTEPVTVETGHLFLAAMHTAMVIFSLLGFAGMLCSIGRTRKK
ncbi:MAG: MFS transporter [Desulfobulbaceae bacterium BRH_c16a]|nr:MAG: MFS transporter [Desulfobulbaceae bacterium BRH_c16a]